MIRYDLSTNATPNKLMSQIDRIYNYKMQICEWPRIPKKLSEIFAIELPNKYHRNIYSIDNPNQDEDLYRNWMMHAKEIFDFVAICEEEIDTKQLNQFYRILY